MEPHDPIPYEHRSGDFFFNQLRTLWPNARDQARQPLRPNAFFPDLWRTPSSSGSSPYGALAGRLSQQTSSDTASSGSLLLSDAAPRQVKRHLLRRGTSHSLIRALLRMYRKPGPTSQQRQQAIRTVLLSVTMETAREKETPTSGISLRGPLFPCPDTPPSPLVAAIKTCPHILSDLLAVAVAAEEGTPEKGALDSLIKEMVVAATEDDAFTEGVKAATLALQLAIESDDNNKGQILRTVQLPQEAIIAAIERLQAAKQINLLTEPIALALFKSRRFAVLRHLSHPSTPLERQRMAAWKWPTETTCDEGFRYLFETIENAPAHLRPPKGKNLAWVRACLKYGYSLDDVLQDANDVLTAEELLKLLPPEMRDCIIATPQPRERMFLKDLLQLYPALDHTLTKEVAAGLLSGLDALREHSSPTPSNQQGALIQLKLIALLSMQQVLDTARSLIGYFRHPSPWLRPSAFLLYLPPSVFIPILMTSKPSELAGALENLRPYLGDIQYQRYADAALVYALENDETSCIPTLLRAGASPNVRVTVEQIGINIPALTLAIVNQWPLSLLTELLDAGADPEGEVYPQAATALYFALNPAVRTLLLERGANPLHLSRSWHPPSTYTFPQEAKELTPEYDKDCDAIALYRATRKMLSKAPAHLHTITDANPLMVALLLGDGYTLNLALHELSDVGTLHQHLSTLPVPAATKRRIIEAPLEYAPAFLNKEGDTTELRASSPAIALDTLLAGYDALTVRPTKEQREQEGVVYGDAEIRKGLSLLVNHVKIRDAFIGTPREALERNEFYRDVEAYLKHILAAIRKMDEADAIPIYVDLGIAGLICGSRWKSEARLIYNMVCGGRSGETLEERVAAVLKAEVSRTAMRMSHRWGGDTHALNQLMHIAGLDAADAIPPLGLRTEKEITNARRALLQQLLPATVVTDYLRRDSEARDLFFEWVKDHIPEAWTEQHGFSDFESRLEEIEAKHQACLYQLLAERGVTEEDAQALLKLLEQAPLRAVKAQEVTRLLERADCIARTPEEIVATLSHPETLRHLITPRDDDPPPTVAEIAIQQALLPFETDRPFAERALAKIAEAPHSMQAGQKVIAYAFDCLEEEGSHPCAQALVACNKRAVRALAAALHETITLQKTTLLMMRASGMQGLSGAQLSHLLAAKTLREQQASKLREELLDHGITYSYIAHASPLQAVKQQKEGAWLDMMQNPWCLRGKKKKKWFSGTRGVTEEAVTFYLLESGAVTSAAANSYRKLFPTPWEPLPPSSVTPIEKLEEVTNRENIDRTVRKGKKEREVELDRLQDRGATTWQRLEQEGTLRPILEALKRLPAASQHLPTPWSALGPQWWIERLFFSTGRDQRILEKASQVRLNDLGRERRNEVFSLIDRAMERAGYDKEYGDDGNAWPAAFRIKYATLHDRFDVDEYYS